MGIRTEAKVIDGVSFETTQFTGRLGLTLQARLLRLAGGAIAEAFTALGKLEVSTGNSILDTDLSGVDAGSIMEKLGEGLANEDVARLAVDLLANTRMNGVPISEGVFDMEFAGRYDLLVKALFWVIQANNFFKAGGIGALLQKKIPAADSPEN